MEDSPDKATPITRSNPNFHDECKRIANELTSQRTTILKVVLSLESYFSSKDIEKREEGLHVLSKVLEYIPITSLKEEEFIQFCMFYKSRLNDHYKVIPELLNGILALSKYNLPMKTRGFTEILTSMFQTVSCQAQAHSERLKIYMILQNMLRNQTEELLDLGPDFVYGVISAFDGERDPRNLYFVFRWLPEFIHTVQLGHLCEEMFEVISCYFPVDFRVPAHDANGIGRDLLAEALTPCLCASNDFAEQTVQLALEKLDSDLQIAKCDSLRVLLYGSSKFTSDVYVQNGVWPALQKQLLKCPSFEVEALLLETITEISRKLSADHFANVFDNIIETNAANLNATEKFFAPTCKLFLAMSKGNEACAKRIMPDVQPRLINLLHIAATKEQQVAILRVLIEFIKVGDRYNTNTPGIPYLLLTFASQLEPELRALSLEALCFINTQFEGVKLQLLKQWGLLITERTTANVENAFHQCILHHASKCTGEITALVKSLPSAKFEALMEHLCELCSIEPFVELFTELLDNNFEAHTGICLENLNKALKLHSVDSTSTLFRRLELLNIIEGKLLCCSLSSGNASDFLNLMNILMHIIGIYSGEQQSLFVDKHLPRILEQFQHETNAIYFVAGIITNLNLENLEDFHILDRLFELSLSGLQIASELLANMINKLPQDTIAPFIARFHSVLAQRANSLQEEETHHYGVTLLWLTKALYMRGYDNKQNWLNLLMEYLKDLDVIATGMETILSDACPLLSRKSHCRRMLLYKQQFFIEACQLLDRNFMVENNNYIVAFGSLLQGVPSFILKMNFVQFVRLIVLCLDHSVNATGIVTILSTIKSLIQSKDSLCEQYLDDFLPRMLHLSQFPKSMQVRILALECLQLYINTDIPKHKLMKHKTRVTDALSRCVDDRKRLVRKEAADARLKWFLLGAPI